MNIYGLADTNPVYAAALASLIADKREDQSADEHLTQCVSAAVTIWLLDKAHEAEQAALGERS